MSWMTGRMVRGALLLAAVALLGQVARAQSLADLSRQERAKRAAKTTKEFTNDSIPAIGTSAPAPAAAPAAAGTAAAGAKPEAKPEDKKDEPSQADLEKEYRAQAAKLRETVSYEERRLDVLQRELNLTQQQYYSDPNVALREQYSREDINKRTAEIEAQKAVVDKAKQAISDLEEELRKKSLPIGWAR